MSVRRRALSLLAFFAAATLSAIFVSGGADAAFAPYIGYQAKLTNPGGAAVDDGDYNVEFKIYDAPTGGSLLWTETRTSGDAVAVDGGLFSVQLGEVTAIDGLDFDQELWLSVNIGGTGTPSWDGEMTPRRRLSAVPAAFVAQTAKSLDAVYATTTNLYVGTRVGIGTTSPYAALSVVGQAVATYFTGTSTTATSTFMGAVGVGTSTPGARFAVQGNSLVSGTSTATVFVANGIPITSLTANSFSVGTGAGAVGADNTNFIGFQAGSGATGADSSNFIGYQAGSGATNASYANLIGHLAGFGATSANNAVFIGNQAGYGAAGSYSSNFLGTTAGYNALNATYSNFLGYAAGISASNAYNSNFLGPSAGDSATNANNSNFFGSSAGLSATGAYEANFLGFQAGSGATSAYGSNFLGYVAGSGAYDAALSNFLGNQAGYQAASAHRSNFFGVGAGYSADYANQSNFIGILAGSDAYGAYSSNFIGERAGERAYVAPLSNFLGAYAGWNAQNASDSIFIGSFAGYLDAVNNNAASGTSIAIGRYSGTGGHSNSIAIGRGVINSAANQANIGNVLYLSSIYGSDSQSASPTGGYVGIGTTTPGSILSVAGVANFTPATSTFVGSGGIDLKAGCFAVNGVCVTGGGGGGSGTVGSGTTGQLPYYAANGTTLSATSSIFLASSGKLGVGTTTPPYTVTAGLTSSPALAALDVSSGDGKLILVSGSGGVWNASLSVGNPGTLQVDQGYLQQASNGGWMLQSGGSASAPSYTFKNDGDTGFFGGNNGNFVAISTGGTEAARFTGGFLGIGTSTPTAKLAVAGGNIQHVASGTPTLVGSYDTGFSASAVAVSGRYAYVASSDGSYLEAFDVSDPTSPQLVGQTASAAGNGIAVSGGYVYVADLSFTLGVFGLANPANPTWDGAYNSPSGTPSDIAVQGHHAYLAEGASGLRIFDVSNPQQPVRVGTYDTSGSANGVAVVGKYAYVADGSAGLRVVDVSVPHAPTLVGTYNTSGTAADVAVVGRFAYVADAASGVQIVDVTDPTAPTLAGTYDTSGSAVDIAVDGLYAYVADSASGLHVLSLASSTSPSLVGTYNTSGNALGVAVHGGYAYVADGSAGLEIFETGHLTTPGIKTGSLLAGVAQVLGNLSAGSLSAGSLNLGVGGLFSGGTVASRVTPSTTSVAARFSGGDVVVAPDEQGAMFAASTNLGGSYTGSAFDVEADGDYAYLVGYPDLKIADVSVAGEPTLLGTFEDATTDVNAVAVSGGYAYLASYGVGSYDSGLRVLDVSDPTAPVPVDFINTLTADVLDVAASGRYVYAAVSGEGLRVYDATRPEGLAQVGSYSLAGVQGVLISGRRAYLADSAGAVAVLDISNPASPALVASVGTSGTPQREMRLVGTILYVPESDFVSAIDVAGTPTLLASYSGTGFQAVEVVGERLFVSGDAGYVYVFDVSDPETITYSSSFEASSGSMVTAIHVSGSRMLMSSEDSSGSLIEYRLSALRAPSVVASSIEATVLRVLRSLGVGGDLSVAGGVNVGGGIYARGYSSLGPLAVRADGHVAAGSEWEPRAAAEQNEWFDVAYGEGTFVAVANTGTNRVMTSTDGGNTWVARAAAEANQWRGIAYGGGTFVAVANTGTNRVMTSPDGVTWTPQAAAEANDWRSVAYGNGTFVAVSFDGTNRVMTSPDGVTWTPQAAAEANGWRAVTYGNGTFVAVAYDGTNRVMTSPDGVTWTPRAAASANAWRDVVYGNGTFVAVTNDGTSLVMTSTDGVTWSSQTAQFGNWSGVAYGDGLFVAVGNTINFMTSPDGVTWTLRHPNTDWISWLSVTYGEGVFVAVSQSGGNNRVAISRGSAAAPSLDVAGSFGRSALAVSGDNVGIGTSTPSERLHIVGGNVLIDARDDLVGSWSKIASSTEGAISTTTSGIASTSAMAVYNGSLYVGTKKADGAEVYRYDGGTTWTKVSQWTAGTISAETGASTTIDAVTAMAVYDGYLYIGTTESNRAQVYRYDGGTSWTSLNFGKTPGRFLTQTAIDGISAMTVHNGALFIGTTEPNAAEVYRYDGGTTWSEINTTAGTFNTTASVDAVTAMSSFNGFLYVGTSELNVAQVLRWDGLEAAAAFTRANVTAGTLETTAGINGITSMTVYNGALYVGTNELNNAEVYQYMGAVAAVSFQKVSGTAGTIGGNSTTAIDGVSSLVVYNGQLYAGTYEPDGMEVYRYGGAATWTRITSGGYPPTAGSYSGQSFDAASLIPFDGRLVLGLSDTTNGMSVWWNQGNEGISNALQFHAASDNAGAEVGDFRNIGQIRFSSENTALGNSSDEQTGSFLFSHSISTTFGAYDLAEDYPTRDEDLAPGDLVSLDTRERGMVRRSVGKGDTDVVGIYSEKPALRLSQAGDTIDGAKAVPVALAGRVPVKVSLEGGEIKIGDYLTASSEPGVAMKATRPGRVIGRALSPFDGVESDEDVARVMVFIGAETVGWDDILRAGVVAEQIAVVDATLNLAAEVAEAASDLALAAISASGKATEVVAGKVVALVASVQKLFVDAFTLLPGGSLTVPSGENQISGTSVLPAGATAVEVQNEDVQLTSKIFVTPVSSLSVPLVVTEKTEGVGFRVEVSAPQAEDVTFDWLIVQSYQPEGTAATSTTDAEFAAPADDTFATSSVSSEPGETVFDDGTGEATAPEEVEAATSTPAETPAEVPTSTPAEAPAEESGGGGGGSAAEPAEEEAPAQGSDAAEAPADGGGTPAGEAGGEGETSSSAPSDGGAESSGSSGDASGGGDSSGSSAGGGSDSGGGGDGGAGGASE